jgi:hypothetical protein
VQLLLVLAVPCVLAAPVRTEPLDDDDKDDPPEAVQVQQFGGVADENFDMWIFQENNNNGGRVVTVRQRLDRLLVLHVENIERTCKLTRAQRKKLFLAGKGDIKTFLTTYDKARQRFDALKNDQQKLFREIWQDISPLQTMLQSGMFGEGSFMSKAVRNSLTPEQYALYESGLRERRDDLHRARIELCVASIEQHTPLLESQRQELIALLLKYAKPIRKPLYAYYAMMYHLSQVPEEKLTAVLDSAQWKAVQNQMRNFKQIRQQLKQSGSWPEDDEDGDKAEKADKPDKPAAQPAARK